MNPPLTVEVTDRAKREIRRAADWWTRNRAKAPEAFREDLQRAFETLARQPRIGTPAKNESLAGVRRLHLKRVRYYLYYRLQKDPERIQILALWHTSRGMDPELG